MSKNADNKKASKNINSQKNDELYAGIDNYVKVPHVDTKKFEAEISEINVDVSKLREKMNTFAKQIAEKNEGKSEYFRQKDLVKSKVDEKSGEINKLDTARKAALDKIYEMQRQEKNSRTEINSLKKKIGYDSEEQIDSEIGKIEYQLQTETLTLKREKELITKISQLRQTKPQLKKLTHQVTGLNSDKSKDEAGQLRVLANDYSKKIAELRDERRTHQEEFNKLIETRKEMMSGMSDVFEARDVLSKAIGEKMAQIKAIREEKSKQIAEMNKAIAHNRKIDDEIRDRERQIWEKNQIALKEAEEIERDNQIPFADELELIENIKGYLASLGSTAENAGGVSTAQSSLNKNKNKTFDDPDEDGHVDDFKIKDTRGGANKKKKKKGGSQSESAFVHSLETLSLFAKMNITPPAKASNIPDSFKSIENKLEEIKKRQEVEYKEREIRKQKRLEEKNSAENENAEGEAAVAAAPAAVEVN